MLGAVVLEHAAQVAQPREQQQVAEEDRGPHDALDQPEQDRGSELVLDQARQPDRDDEEQPDRECERDHHASPPTRRRKARSCILLARQLRVRRDLERAHPDRQRLAERDDAADHRQPVDAAALGPGDQRERLRRDRPERRSRAGARLGRGLAHRDRPVRTPRIITPSSTAWPPTGASRDAVSRAPRRRRLAHAGRRLGLGGCARRAAALGGAALEALDATTGVDQLLPARVERMAGGADLDVDLGLGRAGHEFVAAGAADVGVDVFRMDFGLHSTIQCSGLALRRRARDEVVVPAGAGRELFAGCRRRPLRRVRGHRRRRAALARRSLKLIVAGRCGRELPDGVVVRRRAVE